MSPREGNENPLKSSEFRELIDFTRRELSMKAEELKITDQEPLTVKPSDVVSAVDKQKGNVIVTPDQIAQVTLRIPYESLS